MREEEEIDLPPARERPLDLPPDDRPRRRPDPPEGLRVLCYAVTAAAAVMTIMPCVWVFAAPLAAFSATVCAYLNNHYRRCGNLLVATIVAAIVLFVNIAAAIRAHEKLDLAIQALDKIDRRP